MRKDSGVRRFADGALDRQSSLLETAGLEDGRIVAAKADGSLSLPGNLGRYQFKEELGRGGMGAVYLARDTHLQRDVAIKVPRFGEEATQKSIARFYQEARSAANLSHPNICQVFDVGEIDSTHYIAMALLKGRPLSHYVQSGKPTSPRTAATIVRKVALGLHEAHVHGIIHRDVKPANIMIDHRNEPIVMDFGLAVAHESGIESRLTQDGDLLGSPAYMSPEQLQGNLEVIGPRSDVYALGVVLYELLAGQLPFSGEGSTVAMIGRILSERPQPLSSVRPDLEPTIVRICEKAMRGEPSKRYESMDAFANALSLFLKSGKSNTDTPRNLRLPDAMSIAQIQILEKAKIAKSLWESKQISAVVPVLKQIVQDPNAKGSKALKFAQRVLPQAEQALAKQNSQDRPATNARPSKTKASVGHVCAKATVAAKKFSWKVAAACIGLCILVLLTVSALWYRHKASPNDATSASVENHRNDGISQVSSTQGTQPSAPELKYEWPDLDFDVAFDLTTR